MAKMYIKVFPGRILLSKDNTFASWEEKTDTIIEINSIQELQHAFATSKLNCKCGYRGKTITVREAVTMFGHICNFYGLQNEPPKVTTEQYLTDTVLKRVSEFKEDPNIVQYVKDNFETAEAAQEYLIKMAVATLMIPVSERP